MLEIKKNIDKLSKSQKIICLISLLVLVILISVGIPTLARYKNRSTIVNTPVWDGSIASNYKKGSGTEADPFIISNGSELAYFNTQLSNNNYDNTYFSLSNDIILNKGIFNYEIGNKIQYILDDNEYYIEDYTNKYYDNIYLSGQEVGTLNNFSPLDGFKGIFDGGSFTIYGLYLTEGVNEELALFTDLQGTVKNLYVENSMVYGGTVSAGIASTTNNALLSNILFNGYVIGKSTDLEKSITINPNDLEINLQNIEKLDYINSSNNVPFVGSEIVSTSITGNYTINGSTSEETSIKINGTTVTNGAFEINLGNDVLENIPVLTSTTSAGATLTISNLSYNIVYKCGVSGGIIGQSNNTKIENTINKSKIYGYSSSGGLVGVTTSLLEINQSYNIGDITSEYVGGGLVGVIEKSGESISISKSYNAGEMNALNTGGLIGVINNNIGSVLISDVFNASTTEYSIGTINNTMVDVNNVYYVNGLNPIKSGMINGSFISTTLSNLKTKSYITANLLFNEFVDFNDLMMNKQNAWIYENDSLPLLYIDDINKPVANIHVSNYSWNNLSYELNKVKMESNITFSIEGSDELIPLKEKYYYISNSSTPLSKKEISNINNWTLYNDIVQINDEGNYVIYVKVVDYNDSITYINTDVLVLDLLGPTVNISFKDNNWVNLRQNLDYLYINKQENITIEAVDDLSGILSVKYYITNEFLSINDLKQLNSENWIDYSNQIEIIEIGTYVIYVQAIDNYGNTTYVSSDYIILNGYTEAQFTIGRNSSSYLDSNDYITDKSIISLNISYSSNSSDEFVGYDHNLMSNILLPLGTKIQLFDNITNKNYEYKITTDADIYNYNNSCDSADLDCVKTATYPLTLFKEIGTGNDDKFFSESTYFVNGDVNENFTIVLDLSNTNISNNYDHVMLYMELHDISGKNVRPTLYNTIKNFNIYSSVGEKSAAADLYLTTDYQGSGISFNTNSSTSFKITSKLNYKYVDNFKIIDTTYEDKEIGLSIKMVDSNGNIVDKEKFKSIIFKVDDKEYHPEEDNIIRINLKNGINDVTKNLTIITNENNSNLVNGTYYFKISNYASYDGIYYDKLNSDEVSISVNVSDNTLKIPYNFDVSMDDTNRIISKLNNDAKIMFNILQKGPLYNPNIKISLFKKTDLTAYNQEYISVDLSNYVSNSLDRYSDNVYNLLNDLSEFNNVELTLITSNFENNGYKFVFYLYDGVNKVGTIEKYFIVKEG